MHGKQAPFPGWEFNLDALPIVNERLERLNREANARLQELKRVGHIECFGLPSASRKKTWTAISPRACTLRTEEL